MKKSKREKISFDVINEDKYSIISPEKISESNVRIKNEMKEFLKKNKK